MTFEDYISKRLGFDYQEFFLEKSRVTIIEKLIELGQEYAMTHEPNRVVEVEDELFRIRLQRSAKKFDVAIKSKGRVLWIYGTDENIKNLNDYCIELGKKYEKATKD